MRIPQGTYSARAVSAAIVTMGEKKTPAVAVVFHIQSGDVKGTLIEWTGFLTPAARERTVESLEHCGFDGEDLGTCCNRDVAIVVEDDEYEGVIRSKVRWVNDPNRAGSQQPMDPAQKAQAMADLKGLVLGNRQKRAQAGGAPAGPTAQAPKFDFGNTPMAGPPPKPSGGWDAKGQVNAPDKDASFDFGTLAPAPAPVGPGTPDPKAGF